MIWTQISLGYLEGDVEREKIKEDLDKMVMMGKVVEKDNMDKMVEMVEMEEMVRMG